MRKLAVAAVAILLASSAFAQTYLGVTDVGKLRSEIDRAARVR